MSSRSWHNKLLNGDSETQISKKEIDYSEFFLPGILFLLVIAFLWILQPQFVKVDEEVSWIRIILIAAICGILFWYITDYFD